MDEDTGTKYCSNCKRDIAATNYVMHEVHCKRNIVLCKKCQEPIPRSELDAHEEEEHKLVPCDLCSVQFEVSALEEHKENCPKRKVHCAYCEIDCARDELDTHMGYCGTRTEQCARCSQFIMHKDQTQHDATQCAYPPQPEVPAAATSHVEAQQQSGMDFPASIGLFGDPYSGGSSFRSRELMRLVEPHASFLPPGARHGPLRLRPSVTPHTHHTLRDFIRPNVAQEATSAAAAAGAGSATSGLSSSTNRVPTKRSVVTKRNDIRPKNTNVQRAHAATRGSSSRAPANSSVTRADLNLTEHDQPAASASNTNNVDRLLAMQLGNGLDMTTADFNGFDFDHLHQAHAQSAAQTGMVQADGGDVNPAPAWMQPAQEYPIPSAFQPSDDDLPSDTSMAPCEFCDREVPLTQLIEHQSGCDHAPASLLTPAADINIDPNTDQSRQTGVWETLDDVTPPPHVERRYQQPNDDDNMAYLYAQENGLHDADSAMIPCEFCDEAYPADLLLVHQPVCDKNHTQTPRAVTPAVAVGRNVPNPLRQNPTSQLWQPLTRRAGQSSPSTDALVVNHTKRSKARPGPDDLPSTRLSGRLLHTPEYRRQNSSSRVERTLDSFIRNPADRPLAFDTSARNNIRDVNDYSTYQPSFAPNATLHHNGSRVRRGPLTPTVYDDSSLDDASALRTNVIPSDSTRGGRAQPRSHWNP